MENNVAAMVSGDPELSKFYSTTGSTELISTTACTYPLNWGWGYPYYSPCSSKPQQAFAIAKALILKKVVKASTVTKFIELVELIETTL